MSEFIQVGITAMRDPMTGELLDAVPLYVQVGGGQDPPLPEIDRKSLYRDLMKKMHAMAERMGDDGGKAEDRAG